MALEMKDPVLTDREAELAGLDALDLPIASAKAASPGPGRACGPS